MAKLITNPIIGATPPVMMAISCRTYSYLLDQVTIYEANLAEQATLDAGETHQLVMVMTYTTILVVQQYVQC